MTARASGRSGPRMATTPGFRMPAFSPAIAASVDQRMVDAGLCEEQEGDGGGGVEEARPCFARPGAQALHMGTDPANGVDQARFVDGTAIQTEALDPALEMR